MRVHYAIVFVSDMARSVAFYRDTLEIPLKFESLISKLPLAIFFVMLLMEVGITQFSNYKISDCNKKCSCINSIFFETFESIFIKK